MIHLAFKHDLAFSGDFAGAADADRRAVETFGEALAGTGKPLVIASGLLGLAPGRVATEADGHGPVEGGLHGDGPSARHATAEFTLQLADRGVRSSVLRLPPTVHGGGDTGFVGPWSDWPGPTVWPATSGTVASGGRPSTATTPPACSGWRWSGPRPARPCTPRREEGVPLGDVAAAIGRQLDVPVRPVPDAEAADHFLWLGPIGGAGHTGVECGDPRAFDWTPTGPALLDDLAAGSYTDGPA